jgi:cytochrome b
MVQKVRVWDVPTRLFHWLLVVLFAFSWWSAEQREMAWHQLSGTILLGLLAFRILWGFIGGSTARFTTFLKSPRRALSYLRSRPAAATAGHNPLGGYGVIAMLTLLATQISSGLFAVDVDGVESGPLSFLVSFEAGRSAAAVHEVSFNILLGLIALHLAAVLYYTVVKRQPLIRRMITGADTGLDATNIPLVPASPVRLLVGASIAAAFAWWISNGLAF